MSEESTAPTVYISRWNLAHNRLGIEIAQPRLNPKWATDQKKVDEALAEIAALRLEAEEKGINPAWL